MYAFMYVCMHVCMYVRRYVCMHVCMSVYVSYDIIRSCFGSSLLACSISLPRSRGSLILVVFAMFAEASSLHWPRALLPSSARPRPRPQRRKACEIRVGNSPADAVIGSFVLGAQVVYADAFWVQVVYADAGLQCGAPQLEIGL